MSNLVRALLRKRAVREAFYLWGDNFLGMGALLREHYEVSEFREEHFYMVCNLSISFKRCMVFLFLEITCFFIHPFQRSIVRVHKIWSPALCRNEQKIICGMKKKSCTNFDLYHIMGEKSDIFRENSC